MKWQGENRQLERNVAGGQLPDDHNIDKLEEPQAFADALGKEVDAPRDSTKAKATSIKELKDFFSYAFENYRQLKPQLDEINAIKVKGERLKFKEAHE